MVMVNVSFNYWKNLAEEDLSTAIYNLQGHKALATLFFFHLAIEKLLKAHWIKDNISNTPPFTHDLQKLFTETTGVVRVSRTTSLAQRFVVRETRTMADLWFVRHEPWRLDMQSV